MIDWKKYKLNERIAWSHESLEPFVTQYRVVYEDVDMDCAAILCPDSRFMAALMHGGLMPPVDVWHKLQEDEARPDFTCHSDFRGHLLHETEPMRPLTEKEAVEFIIMKDVPQHIWRTWNDGNKPKIVICRLNQLPQEKEWRDAWRISNYLGEAA